MQRVRILGGALASAQWRSLAAIAREFTPGAPLRLTTRQDIEFHELLPEHVPAVHRRLVRAGLSGAGACGDTVRNVTVCPCSGAAAGTPDLFPLARRLAGLLREGDSLPILPRKFKISLSCSPACGQPWINDVGLVFQRREGRAGFHVIGAGSLGAKPGPGIVLFDWLSAADAPALVLAALRIFAEHGERANRSRARLRHLRQRLGDEPFLAILREALEVARREVSVPDAEAPGATAALFAAVPMADGARRLAATLTFADGGIDPEAAEALADLADRPNVRVRIGNQHQVLVFGQDADSLARAVAGLPPLAQAARSQASVVACPGCRWCARAVTDTGAIAARIRAALALDPPAVTICVSGCPNGCAQSSVADVGLVGMQAARPGERPDAYDVLAGGGMGRDARLATLVAKRLPADEAAALAVRLARECRPPESS